MLFDADGRCERIVSYFQRTSDNLLTIREAWRACLRRGCTDDQPSVLRGLRLSRKATLLSITLGGFECYRCKPSSPWAAYPVKGRQRSYFQNAISPSRNTGDQSTDSNTSYRIVNTYRREEKRSQHRSHTISTTNQPANLPTM